MDRFFFVQNELCERAAYVNIFRQIMLNLPKTYYRVQTKQAMCTFQTLAYNSMQT